MNNRKVYFWSLTVALGGFLFGFDTAVISGGEQAIQELWNLSDFMVGQMVGMALYGTILGAIFGGIPADKYGRKTTLFWVAILYLSSAIGSAFAWDIYSLMFFRFIGGIGVGASSVAAPMYISEIAPAEKRGQLAALFQFNIVFGILIAFASNYIIGSGENNGWRIMLGVEIIPALLFTYLITKVPRSPRWLVVKKGFIDEARAVLQMINPDKAEDALQEIIKSAKEDEKKEKVAFFNIKYRKPILLAFLIAFFNQVSGINAIIYYAPRIFEDTGMGAESALLSTVGIGIINLIFTLLGLILIDTWGRKKLMYLGSFGYIISLSCVSYVFFTQAGSGTLLVPILLFVFIASHAVGQGAVIWVFISEIFPNEVRSYGNAFGSSTHWVFAALISAFFPFLAGKFGGGLIFASFAFLMFLQLLWVWKVMPETKGITLESIEKKLD
jgi:sugar porter (SP) family MFS transporter